MPKNWKRGLFWFAVVLYFMLEAFSNIHSVAKYQKQLGRDPLVQSKNFQKSLIVPKSLKHQVCFRGSGRRFCFGQGSEVSVCLGHA